jgi:flagellar protein FliT
MAIRLVEAPDYKGEAGIIAMRNVQQALTAALEAEEWERVRHLDRICLLLIDRIIAENRDNKAVVINALSELRGVYAQLLAQCQREVTLVRAT